MSNINELNIYYIRLMLKCNKTLLTSLKEVNSSKKEKKYIQSVDFFIIIPALIELRIRPQKSMKLHV